MESMGELVFGLLVALVGGSVGYVIWWCWIRPRPEPPICERCAVECERLVLVRINSHTGPSYEMQVCGTCVAELRNLGPSRQDSRLVWEECESCGEEFHPIALVTLRGRSHERRVCADCAASLRDRARRAEQRRA